MGKAVAKRAAPLAVAAFLTLLVLAIALLPAYEAARDRALDAMISHIRGGAGESSVVVVDIDRAALDRIGPWPWPREKMAELVDAIAAVKPKAIGLDILWETPDERSPAALAQRLAHGLASEDLRQRLTAEAATLPDGDKRLGRALARIPSTLGVAVSPEAAASPARGPAPVLLQARPSVPDLWRGAGVIGPVPELARSAAGLGVLATLGDSDGRVRKVPLLIAADEALWPGLALDVVRAAAGASAFIVTADGRLRAGDHLLRLPGDAMLRLDPVDDALAARSTVSAADALSDTNPRRLEGKLVLVGSSAPELGGLRTAHFGALQPSVQLQAAALRQLLRDRVPYRPGLLVIVETAALLAAGIAALVLAMRSPPMRAGAFSAALAATWFAASAVMAGSTDLLPDPLGVPISAIGSFALAALITASATRRKAEALRRRFEQHLAPELVRRIAESPDLVKLSGEEREVTILFTDIEGFTAMTERSDPIALIQALDRYLEGATGIVVAHGGMVEKIVGDGLHALFNAPLDLAEHAEKAIACAQALQVFSAAFRREPEIATLGFGRTRIGVATGTVILGDVGGGSKLDYTAYGNAMNLAARLEAANKDLGTAICVSGTTAALAGGAQSLRPLGSIDIRGQSQLVEIFEPWPDDMSEAARQRYLSAVTQLAHDRVTAFTSLLEISSSRPADAALAAFVSRLSARP